MSRRVHCLDSPPTHTTEAAGQKILTSGHLRKWASDMPIRWDIFRPRKNVPAGKGLSGAQKNAPTSREMGVPTEMSRRLRELGPKKMSRRVGGCAGVPVA